MYAQRIHVKARLLYLSPKGDAHLSLYQRHVGLFRDPASVLKLKPELNLTSLRLASPEMSVLLAFPRMVFSFRYLPGNDRSKRPCRCHEGSAWG